MVFDNRLEAVFRDVLGRYDLSLSDDMTPDDVEAWDSLNHINLMLVLEEEFDVPIPMDRYVHLQSVKAIKDFLMTAGGLDE